MRCGRPGTTDSVDLTFELTKKDLRQRGDDKLTQAHDNTVAESLWVAHQFFGFVAEVFQHLHCLGILQCNVFFVAARLVEGLVDQFAEQFPFLIVGHDEQMIAFGDEIV